MSVNELATHGKVKLPVLLALDYYWPMTAQDIARSLQGKVSLNTVKVTLVRLLTQQYVSVSGMFDGVYLYVRTRNADRYILKEKRKRPYKT